MRALPLIIAGALLSSGAQAQTALDLQRAIAAEIQSNCQPGSTVVAEPGAVEIGADRRATVYMQGFTCRWKFTHPFCGARACEVRTYAIEGNGFRLIGSRLQ